MLYNALLRRAFRTVYGPLPAPPAAGEETGLVLVADGVGGFDLCAMGLQYATAWAGLRHRLQVVGWGHGFGRWYRDLTNVPNHVARAGEVVVEAAEFRQRHPELPVFLVGKSGGTGIVVRALEQMPEGSVEAAVLIASALSPRYDLTRALRTVRRELVAFWSPLDAILLGAGTSLFGTIDRVRGPGAGMVRFRPPRGADLDQYAKLRQVRWHPRMWTVGNLGGHIGPDHPRFLRSYVVPVLELGTELEGRPAAGSSHARPAPIT